MARRVMKMRTLALAFCGYTSLTGCSGVPGTTAPESNTESTGTVGLALQLAGGQTIDSANYTIVGPNGFSKTGSLDLSAATKLSATPA
jgi:hypothetical protein